MSTKASRRERKMIRAASRAAKLLTEAVSVNWIEAAEGDSDKPKRFTMTAYTGGPMNVDRYGPPVAIDLQGMTAKAPIPILANHDMTQIVGHADEVTIDASTLKLSGVISGASVSSEQIQASSKLGFPWKASVGARPDKLEFVGEDVKTIVNGKSLTGPIYVARKSTLGEVSFVAVAADGRTTVKVAASAANHRELDMNFEQWIEAMGLDVAELRDDQLAKLREKYAAEIKAAEQKELIEGSGKTPEVTPPAFDLSGIVLTYEKHVAAVQAKASSYAGKIAGDTLATIQATAQTRAAELKSEALQNEWAPIRLEIELVKAAASAEVELIKAEMPKGPGIRASMRDGAGPAIEAAFAISAGLQTPEKYFAPEVLEAADQTFGGFGLQETMLHFARQGGYTGRERIGLDNAREVMQAAFSIHSLTTLLTSTGNKILLDGFNSIPQSWREVAQIRTVSDFKTVTAFRMTADLEYAEVGPGGEIQHGTVSQESYTLKALTYAKMLTLTMQDIVNDDLGAFNDLRNRLGLGAAIKMNKVFWTAWLAAYSGAAFWTAARGNLVTSSSLGEAGLNTAVAAFRDLAGPDGNMMNLEPSKILVPSALEATARALYVSQEKRDTTASTKYPTSNIYFNRFAPVVVPELGNSAYTGYSATTWYLLTNPAVLASAIMCFLNGQQAPVIESADADFNTLGVQFRGYHNFGCSMSEYRASVAAEA
ncbi:MAG TPA: hypothetical protein VMX74_03795 [Pirellulales bacterium]|nr:hypothetical protein [Pirellulales bacterium]